MYKTLIHRIVIIMGFFISLISLIINLMLGRDLLYSTFVALCVLFAVSTILFIAFQSIGRMLMNYLAEKRRLTEAEKEKTEKKEKNEENEVKS